MRHIHNHFKKADPVLFSYIDKVGLIDLTLPKDLFSRLCRSIISQQLSSRAADTMYTRFKKLFPKSKISPQAILKLSNKKIRSCGTSWAKVASLKDLAQRVVDKKLHLNKFDKMNDEEVIAELIRVKGIGPWTAEMFLMFALGREDIFSHGDLGLRNAIHKMYRFKKPPTRVQIEKIVKKWSPYRSFASRILWKSLEVKT